MRPSASCSTPTFCSPFTLRDTLLRAAARGLVQVHWSDEILAEATRNLIGVGHMTAAQAAHLVAAMRDAFREAQVIDYERLIPSMPNQTKDRHVAAAAIKAGAQVIVTSNLRDFRPLPLGIEAKGPDDFLLDLLDLAPAAMVDQLRRQSAALRRPPVTLDRLLVGLGRTAPRFEVAVRAEINTRVLRKSA
ncbi:MAG: PIN domain-containing protein [Myxococcales bacterium]|nr:PIN domain-containing protein [Myxococcales bacterium]